MLNTANLQNDYNTAKASLATAQAALDAAAAALLTFEQNCQALEADGAPGIAQWFRQRISTEGLGYQAFGSAPKVTVFARTSAAPDPTISNPYGPVTSNDNYKAIAATGFVITP
jgi:hypothetical protein